MSDPKPNDLMERIVSLCKRRGFIFQSSEIYGGINGFWDYGPLGAELKRNIKDCWWRRMTQQRDDVVGLDATIIMHPKIWEASGHVETFADMMVECPITKKRFRADQVEPQSGTVYSYVGAYGGEQLQKLIEGIPIETRHAISDEFLLSYAKPNFDPNVSLQRSVKEFGGTPDLHVALIKAVSLADASEAQRMFSILIPHGKPPESARKVVRQFYESRGCKFPVPFGETRVEVKNSIEFNPENGAKFPPARPFNLMFKTQVGPVESAENTAYLRPETAQAIFAQFKNVLDSSRQKVPFGICQAGKAFRNEVTPRNFTFRSREFEQMELEFFIRPDEAIEAITGSVTTPQGQGHPGEPQPNWGWQAWHKYWVEERIRFYGDIGLSRDTLLEYWQKPEELAHYARACVDLLFKFPFGAQELEGIAARSDFDLSQHEKFSGKPMAVFDEDVRGTWAKVDAEKKAGLQTAFANSKCDALKKKGVDEAQARTQADAEAKAFFEKLAKGQYIPHVIEPSAGVDRLALALICNAYHEETVTDEKGKPETRVVMKFHPRIAPYKVGVFPLLKNRPELVKKALEVRDMLRPHMAVFYDDAGAIGRRYRRQDEAGTPFGVTIDFDTLGEKPELLDTVTLRDRDSMEQKRVRISELTDLLLAKIR
jgi:glycyl-tRNA synthetase